MYTHVCLDTTFGSGYYCISTKICITTVCPAVMVVCFRVCVGKIVAAYIVELGLLYDSLIFFCDIALAASRERAKRSR